MEKSANTVKKAQKRKAPPTAWKKGESGNPAGRPGFGQSWAEVIKKIGDMTPGQAAKHCREIAGSLSPMGDKITMKEAVVMRVYASLLFEPTPGLLNAFMERVEGKVTQPVEVSDWRKEAEANGIDAEALVADLFSKVPQVTDDPGDASSG